MSDDQAGKEVKKEHEGKISFVESLRSKTLQQPDVPLSTLIPGLNAIVSSLPPEEYAEYLGFLDRGLAIDTQELIVDQFDIFTERLERDVRAGVNSEDPKEQNILREIVDKTKAAIASLDATTGGEIPSVKLKRLYDLVHSDIPYLRNQAAQYIPALIRFDNMKREENSDETELSLREITESDIISMIVDPSKRDIDTAVTLLRSLQSEFSAGDLKDLYFKTIAAISEGDAETIRFVFKTFANFFSLEIALRLLIEETTKESVDPKLKKNAGEILQLFTEKGAIFLNPEELYADKLDMKTWKPNAEHLPHDVEVLLKEFPHAQSLLDIACGTGPHIHALTEAGKTVSGVDVTEKNVLDAIKLNPNADIKRGDWYHLPYLDQSFDGGYCIGRSAAHNFTILEWIAFFREARRVVKGPFVIDSARPDQGGVGKRVEAYQKAADDLQITNREAGAHIGNPVDNAYTYRNILSEEQVKATALLAGYKATKIDEYVYTDQRNQPNTNIYWSLTPLTEKLSTEELFEASRKAFTGQEHL